MKLYHKRLLDFGFGPVGKMEKWMQPEVAKCGIDSFDWLYLFYNFASEIDG
jgi:hypothetical protein